MRKKMCCIHAIEYYSTSKWKILATHDNKHKYYEQSTTWNMLHRKGIFHLFEVTEIEKPEWESKMVRSKGWGELGNAIQWI